MEATDGLAEKVYRQDQEREAEEGQVMASGFYSPFPERKSGRSGPHIPVKAGTAAGGGSALHDSPPGYKPAGSGWGTSFNRKMKAPVVKTRTKKQGLD